MQYIQPAPSSSPRLLFRFLLVKIPENRVPVLSSLVCSQFMVNPQIEKGIALQRRGNLTEAAALYRTLINEDSENAEALHYLGLVNYQQGNIQIAGDLMSQSLHINPSCANTLSDLGMVRVKCEQYQESIPLFIRALQLNANHTDALNNLAVAFKKLNQFERALRLYHRLLKLRPHSVQVLCDLADTQYKTNDVAAAINNYQKAIKLEPNDKYARISLGEALESAGKFKQARMQYLSVLGRDENSSPALSRLLRLRNGEIDKKWIDKAHELINSVDIETDERASLNIALGHYYDYHKACDEALGQLKPGNDQQFQKAPEE